MLRQGLFLMHKDFIYIELVSASGVHENFW